MGFFFGGVQTAKLWVLTETLQESLKSSFYTKANQLVQRGWTPHLTTTWTRAILLLYIFIYLNTFYLSKVLSLRNNLETTISDDKMQSEVMCYNNHSLNTVLQTLPLHSFWLSGVNWLFGILASINVKFLWSVFIYCFNYYIWDFLLTWQKCSINS